MKIVLLGYMGSGKTTAGYILSNMLKYNFLDIDQEIERLEGISVSSIFETKGEIYFRKLENRVIKQILTEEDDLVLATGGGTPCYGDTSEFLKSQPEVLTIYLNTSLDELTMRLKDERSKRPLIAHLENEIDLKDFIRKHLFERAYFYNQAQLTVQTDGKTTMEIVEDILLKLF